MSYCKKEGKDEIIFATEEDMKSPSTALIQVDEDETEGAGLILPNGDINWNCPCLGGMASGPCGTEFRDAFSCFHYSKEEVKGSDCIDHFRKMHECMEHFPELYPSSQEEETDTEKTRDISGQLEDMEREGSKSEVTSDSSDSQQSQPKPGL